MAKFTQKDRVGKSSPQISSKLSKIHKTKPLKKMTKIHHKKISVDKSAVTSLMDTKIVKVKSTKALTKKGKKTTSRCPPDVHESNFSSLWNDLKPHPNLIVKTGQNWQSQLIEETEAKPIPLSIRQKLKEHAQCLYFEDLNNYKKVESKRSSSSEGNMRKTVLSYGTTKDKIAALSLECMESPTHTLNSFSNLISYISPKGKNQYFEIIDNVMNLINTTYLSNNYVAQEFECHNFLMLVPLISSQREKTEKQLVLWYFEDQFCSSYRALINNLEVLSNDTVQKIKMLGLKGLFNLIHNHPHQMTEEILAKLVNKLGDSNQKVCDYVQRSLSNVIKKHSSLKLTLLSLVEELLYRSNIPKRAQHFSLCFLKDFIFRDDDEKLAQKLVKLYTGFFKACAKSGEVDSRFMSVLLRGLHRAYPYAQKGEGASILDEQLDTLYKLCHLVNFNISTQALQLIYQVQGKGSLEVSNRFYQVVYNQLLDPSFGFATSCGAFLNLIFKVLCKDDQIQRVRAFAKRLLQVANYQPAQNICGILFLLSEVAKDNSKLGNLKALLFYYEASAVRMKEDPDNEDESYPDLDADEEGNIVPNKKELRTKEDIKIENEAPSWIHRSNYDSESSNSIRTLNYDPSLRNPLYSGAQFSCFWELIKLKAHYHPSVSLFASQILDEVFIEYSGDPLEDFTNMKFLDRFVQRNPKKQKGDKVHGLHWKPKTGIRKLNVDSKEFSSLDESEVPVEDYFFYKYFTAYAKKEKKIDDDTESISDDEFEDIMTKKNFGEYVDSGLDALDEIDFKKFASGHDIDGDFGYDEDDGGDEELDGGDDELSTDESDAEDEDSEFEDEDNEDLDKAVNAFNARLSDDDEDSEEDEELSEDSADSEISFDDVPQKKPNQKKSKKNRSRSEDDISDLLADSDDYAHFLGSGGEYCGTSEDVFIKDKTGAKQISWEKKRYGGSKFSSNKKQKKIHNKKNKR